ncbi:MAG TPA: tRNA (guanosine(46)-N7)-methyltransferase TrmB [Trueperaceae bacterium]|nr:tRNA (guanosine(46)-N7)-methyltransferase TrmB [Trueperaceae bacterium]
MTRVLLPWRRLPFPADWDHVFGSSGPLHVEVGFGDGRFTVRRAQAEPEGRFVGLEVSSGSVQRALRNVRRSNVGNVRIAKVGAEFAVRQLFEQASLESVVVNFPDPWPKARHEKNRLLKPSFLRLAASRLTDDGEIRLATDHPEYMQFARESAAETGLYDELSPEPPAAVFETKYALKWRDQGKPLDYVVFRRNARPAPAYPHLERPTEMPHSLLRGKLPPTATLAKTVGEHGGGHVVLHEAAAVLPGSEERGSWLVRATVDEPDLKQQLLVLVQQRTPDEVIVRLETFGDPVVTPAVRGAVHEVTEWLSRETALEVRERNY